MNIEKLLRMLKQASVLIEVDGETVRVHAAEGVMTGEISAAIKENKTALIKLFGREKSVDDSDFSDEVYEMRPLSLFQRRQ